jgi:hypothetical protein
VIKSGFKKSAIGPKIKTGGRFKSRHGGKCIYYFEDLNLPPNTALGFEGGFETTSSALQESFPSVHVIFHRVILSYLPLIFDCAVSLMLTANHIYCKKYKALVRMADNLKCT